MNISAFFHELTISGFTATGSIFTVSALSDFFKPFHTNHFR